MKRTFNKYHGAGNDFIIFDNRENKLSLSTEQVAMLCHRHFSIGADGLMLLEAEMEYDFRMVYYNSDGRESTMCGNGGRCMVAFAHKLGLIGMKACFTAIDGAHAAAIEQDKTISLEMKNVSEIELNDTHAILNTGSPHYVKWVDDAQAVDVFNEGRKTRKRNEYQPDGINVNFVQRAQDGLWVRTYERGVEDETLSCGTGVVAAAIASTGKETGTFNIAIQTLGGKLQVGFSKPSASAAENVVLRGPAEFVFEGSIDL